MIRVTVWYCQNSSGAWEHNHIEDEWTINLCRPYSKLADDKARKKQDDAWANKKWKAVYAFKISGGLVSEKSACIAITRMSGIYNYIPFNKLINELKAKKHKEEEYIMNKESNIDPEYGLDKMNYLDTPRNRRIAEIIEKEGACGTLLQLYDVLEFGKDCYSVLCMTTDGPQWGVIIVDGHVQVAGGTGALTAGDYIADYSRTDGEPA